MADSANKIAKPSLHSNEGTFSKHNLVEWWMIPFTFFKSPCHEYSLLLSYVGVVADSANTIAKPFTHSNEGIFSIHKVVEWWLIPFTATKSPYHISSTLIVTMM